MSSSPQVPLGSGPVPDRTPFTAKNQEAGVSWPWLKWFGAIYSFLLKLNFKNIAGLLNISQINATGTRSAATFLRGDASWSPISSSGAVTGMQGDGTVYNAVVPQVGGILEPSLKTQSPGLFLASPPTTMGPWKARKIVASDFQSAFSSAQALVNFSGPNGVGQDTSASAMVLAPWVTATSKLVCSVSGGTGSHPATDEDAAIEEIVAAARGIMPGTGFTVDAYAREGAAGSYVVTIIGLN